VSWRSWIVFALRRARRLVIGLAVVVMASFLMIHLVPGDPARRLAGISAPPSYVQELRRSLHLDEPFSTQFARYLRGVASLDFGRSFDTQQRVSDLLRQRMWNTAKLALPALFIMLFVAVPVGLAAAAASYRRRRAVESLFLAVTAGVGAIPEFLAGTFLAYLIALRLGWLPVAGAVGWQSAILPVATLSLAPSALLARIVRVQALHVLQQDYMKTARSKRLPWHLVYFRHALPNVLTAALTVGGLLFAALLGGAVVVENVFAWPGLGTAIVRAIIARDYPVVEGVTVILGAAVLVINLTVDVVIALVDPRTALREG
jgi:peptide/nickel transport system permease protein